MLPALSLMLVQGVLGAFDTLYFHEYRHHLPGRGSPVSTELKLHAARDFIYALLFFTLPRVRWGGSLAALLWALLACEIIITLWDFHIEVRARAALGGLPPVERATHAIMAILYGAFLSRLIPSSIEWLSLPTGFHSYPEGEVPVILAAVLNLLGLGVFLSGVRDLFSSLGFAKAAWPWKGMGQ